MTDTPSINGWMPPLIYDIADDTKRIATQADIDRLGEIAAAYSDLLRLARQMIDRHDQLKLRLDGMPR